MGGKPFSSKVVAKFQPQFASRLSKALATLNAQGITPVMTEGYRTSGMQAAIRAGRHPYGAARGVSAHQVGLAADFGENVNAGNNDAILSAMTDAGLQNGASFHPSDPVHYSMPGSRAEQTKAMAKACSAAAR